MKTLHTIYSTFAKHNMAKFLTVLTMLLIVGIGQAWAETKTYSYTFSAKQFSANGSKTLNDVSWTLAGNGNYWGYDGTKGQQFGSGSDPYKTLTLSTSGISGTITKIIINTSGASSVNASFTVSVGGTQWGNSTKLTTSATNYTFTGSNSGEIKFSYTQTSSKALYIKSISVTYETAASYTVTYNANGGSGTMTQSTGSSITLKECTFTAPSGKEFDEWNTAANGSGTSYQAGNIVNESLNLYAIWKELPKYTVTWDVNGDQSVKTQVAEGSKPTFPATPASCDDESDTFYGWSTATWDGKIDNISEKTIYTSANNMPAVNGAVTYYAVFATKGAGGGTAFDGTSGGDFKIYALVEGEKKYLKGTGSKISPVDEAEATEYTFTKISDGVFSIKTGTTYLTYVSSTNLGTSNSAYSWTISEGTKGSWRIASTNTTSRGIVYRAGTTNQFGGYATSNITENGTEYYDVEIGGGASVSYSGYITTCAAGDPCASLQAPNVTATATANSITLSWAAVDGATSYNIYNYTTEDLDETTSLTYTFNGLDPETEYEWGVESAKGECFKETRGTTTTSATPCEQLGAAMGLTVVTDFVHTDGKTYVKFSWTPADNTKNYAASQKLCFGKVGEAGTCVDDLAKNLTWTGDLKSKLDPGEYWWSIQALGDGVNYCDGDVVNGTNFTIEAPKTLTNYRTFCDVVCDAYSFHTGTGDKAAWSKDAIKCFEEAVGGFDYEWQIKDYIIPEDDKFFVGNYGYFYNDNLGIGGENGKSRSVVSDWSNMYLAPAMDENDAQGTPRLGHAKGAKGTLRIFEDSNWDNLFVGFIPDGYKLKFGNEEYTFAMHNEGDREYRSEGLVHYEANTFANSVSVGVVDEAGSYVATNHTQEMRHIFLKVSTDWASNNAKFSIYDIGASAFKSGFMKLVPGETDIYEGWVDKDCEKIIFVRHNSTAAEPSFDDGNKWNQTADLDIQASQNMFTITGGWNNHTNTGWAQGLYTKYGQFAMHDNSKSKNWYVHFVPHYVLTYDKNADDAIGEMDIQTVAVDADADDKKVVVANCGFTRPGYRFIKWKYDATLNYNAGVNITLNKDITLYAVWEEEYTVTYDANDGTTSCVDNNAYIKGETVTVCDEVPAKTGYTFLGWSDGNNTYTAGATFDMPASDVTLTAQWQINQYTVTLNPNYPAGKMGTFIDNNGNTVNQVQLTYDYNTPSMPLTDLYQSIELDGYQFDGWYNAKGSTEGTVSGSKWENTGNIIIDRSFYAKWTKVYSVILSENGTTTELDAQTSTSYTLPEILTAGSCDNDEKELVGWSTVAIPTPGDKPASNFYELGETVTLTADQTTFYAVFATVGEGGVDNTDYSNVHTSNVTLTNEGGTNAANSKVKISGVDYTAVKAGTGSAKGAVKITVPAGTTKLSFHIAGWNKEGGNTISLTGATATPSSFTTVADAGVSGSSTTYTLSGTIADYFYSTTLSNIDEETTLTFSNGGGDQRFVIWGVNASTGGAISYSDYTTTCVKLPDPVLSFATEPANPIVFTDAVCGGNSSKQSVTVVGENLRDVVNVSVAGPYKIARTASTALKDFTTSLTLDKTAAGAIHSNYQTVYIISTPPAQSTEATTGTLTFTTTKGNTLTVNLSTPTVTCTQYTLTLVDRGVSTEQPTKYYAGGTIDEAPADPEGVCTDPIHYVFDGWAAATVAEGSTTYIKVTFPYTVEGNTRFYAVYRYLDDGGEPSNDFIKVTKEKDDWTGDYVIVNEDAEKAIGNAYQNTNTLKAIDVEITDNKVISPSNDIIWQIRKHGENYTMYNASANKYAYIAKADAKGAGLSATTTNTTQDIQIIFNNGTAKVSGVDIYRSFYYYGTNTEWRTYATGSYNTGALYCRSIESYLYTTSPVCGPHLVVTEGKDIYVTGGNAGGTRDLVIAQQKVSYKATRLQTSNGLVDGTAPDVKVATNGITIGGVVTQDVKVTIDQTKEQQTDGTYTITGTITVQYQPSANNKQEDIQVQLAVDYNAEARDNFTVHARSLPSEFVIVAKSGDKWYALNGDMNNGSSANPANGQVTLDDDANPTKATYAPCNTIYTFDGVPNTGDRTRVRFQGTDGAWLWAASGTNVGIQNKSLKDTPEGDNKAYNWKLETEDNITYKFHNDNSSRLLGLSGEKFGMYASAVQELRILPYVEKCLYNYAPSNLKVSVLKGTYVTLTWDAVVGATKYQYRTNGTTWTDAGTEPTVTINNLTGATEYTYYIRAYHEDAGVSQECIDYAEITFTTANCDDVPTNITYTADLNSITVSWTAAAPTATIKYNTKEDGTGEGGTINNATSPYEISGGLDKNTTYYIQILADGTCASPIIPVKTEDVEVDIVEWQPQGIIVDINTDETVGVTLENEVSYGSGIGTEATELFFSKYYEASYNVKLVAIYNGTKNIIDLTDYTIQYGKKSWESNYITLKDFGATKGQIQPGEEIILYSMQEGTEDDDIMDCVYEDFPDGNWVEVTSSNNDGKGTLSFGGDKTIILCKTEYDDEEDEYYDNIIDVIGALKNDPNEGILPTNENTEKPSWGDKEGWVCETGLSIADDSQIGISTNRCLLIRNNTVTSGDNAVTQNINDFVTLCSEWKGAHVPDNDIDNGVQASCDNFAYVGTFDYSDYYTKYEEMPGGTSEFDENDRNLDGTVSIYIPDLYKRACSHIRVKLTNEKGEVLTDREYKVPIMITSDQTTAGQAFLELQENLATVEVDGDGNIIDTHPLSLDEVREICKTCDVVIRDNATLTKALDDDTNDHPQVNNVMIYEGASLEIPSGADYNYTINSLSLRRKGDIVASAKVEEGGKLHLPASATAPIYLDMRIDANNWHWFTLPYNCNIADVTWVDGTPAQYNKDWFIMYYDGNSRANEQSIYENHWKVYNGTTIEAGKGYIVGIQGDITHPDYTFELRFPMTTDVLTNEHIDKTVAVNAWGVNMDITPNKKGWNLVGNPYLDYYKTSENISFKGLSLIKYEGIDPVTGERLYKEGGNVPFLVTPKDGGWYEYQQELASDVEMMPFTAYFVQVGDPANASHTDGMELHAQFESDHRGRMSLIRRAPQEVDGEQEPVIVRVEVANAKGESDKTTLIIDDRFTNEYEMNGDFFKWFGDYYHRYTKPVLYSMGADHGKRAFNALSEQLAAQPVALGIFAAQAGDYTFSLTRKRCDLSRVEEVWLYDATTATYTNLMQQDYTFTTAKTEGEGRFYLSVKMRQNAPTDITDIYGGNIVASAKDGQIIVGGLTDNTQLWIYDATGKLLHTEHTTNFQHVYDVPVVGTYFVRTQGAGQAQTIKVLVE